ncbi:MAG TPA: transglycosylase SLT domain-containing protein [Longimicrobium sp.]|nr:transglycosylase SLT domain-containing protein [Longimicrobium sp.]
MSSLREWHGYEESVRWRLVPEGVEIEGSGVERTRGRPTTVTRVWDTFGDAIDAVARARQVPVPTIIATICTESGGNPEAVRLEPGYRSDEETPHRISVGLTQTLLSTAGETLGRPVDRDWLRVPRNAIDAGTAYIARQARTTRLDPPLVAAAYNAGRLAYNPGERNRWKLRQYPIGTGAHCDRFVRFYNDAVFMLASHSRSPAVGHQTLLEGMEPVRSSAPPPRPAPANTPAGAAPAPGDPRVDFGTNADPDAVTAYSRRVLGDILKASGLRRCLVSSTSRNPAEQARVMYDNLERHGVRHQKALYGRGGDAVIDVYAERKGAGDSSAQIRAAMERKIIAIGPTRVSRHASDPGVLNVFDVAPSSITDRPAFESAVRAESRVQLFLKPPGDPGYHLEIPQPA